MNALPRIYADFNNTTVERNVRLNTRGTADDVARLQLQLRDGLHVELYDDELRAEGIVRHSTVDGWVAEIDWDAITPDVTLDNA